ncbi:ABC transporter substrate-binding protein [Nocardioides pocheonensis]|uniref:Extracellular solute-binding protein n=1 Tax=Nocardioides pocheonensis TaxID=661485 RepID=A0A3N0GJJ5_9ACTN|nr:extracellular solute-binding protein [Nocardioides pocheonensis]RNM12645.1 extracellular solute-binding protein [Nocardioides pocheonensis]
MFRRIRRGRTLALALGAASVLALAACGGGSGASASGKTFTVWWYEDAGNPQDAAWQDALKDFKAAHPNVKVHFERKVWQQIQDAGAMILNSKDAPDLLEYNKGNATAGAVSSKGLLTDLTSEASSQGWDKIAGSALTVGTYNSKGLMGPGKLYGIPSYGEYVSFAYNEDMFAKYGVKVPTTMDELDAAFAKFKSEGITPLAESAADYPAQHLLWGLALSYADHGWLNGYFGLKAPLDTSSDSPLTKAAETIADWTAKGYIDKKSSGMKPEDAWSLFRSGKAPITYAGTWMAGDFRDNIKSFKWGQFLMPGSGINPGSGGNIWVVPTKADNKDLAYDFIGLTLDKKRQDLMANAGGVALHADPADVSDPTGKMVNQTFSQLVSSDGLGLYGDWPVPNFYQVIQSNTQTLVAGRQTPDEFMKQLKTAYDQVQSTVGG